MRSYPEEGDEKKAWHLQFPQPIHDWSNTDVGPVGAGAGAGHHQGVTTSPVDPTVITAIPPVLYAQNASATSTHTVNSPVDSTGGQLQRSQFDTLNLRPVSALTTPGPQYIYPTDPLDYPSRAASPYGPQYMVPAPTPVALPTGTFVPGAGLSPFHWAIPPQASLGALGPLRFPEADLVSSPVNYETANGPMWLEPLTFKEPGHTPISTPNPGFVAADGSTLGDASYEDEPKYKPKKSGKGKRKEEPEPEYPPSPHVEPWGPMRNGKHLFQYNEHGELIFEKTYTAKEIKYYIDKCPRPLGIWVQQSPTQITDRLTQSRNRCMWQGCMIRGHKIDAGWLRVAFDEFEDLVSRGLRNPVHVAGCMHLYCYERCFDPVVDYFNDKLKPETRNFPKEGGRQIWNINKSADGGIISESFYPWFDDKTPLSHPRKYELTLSHDLNKHHLHRQTAARQKAREVRKRPNTRPRTIDAHKGDIGYYLDVCPTRKKNDSVLSKIMKDPGNKFQVRGINEQGGSINFPPLETRAVSSLPTITLPDGPTIPLPEIVLPEIIVQTGVQETLDGPLISPSEFLLEEVQAEPSEDEGRPSKRRKIVAEDMPSAHPPKKAGEGSIPSGKVSPTPPEQADQSWEVELDPSLFEC